MQTTGDYYEFVNGVSAQVNEIIDGSKDKTPSFLETGLFGMVNTPDDLIYRTQGVVGLSYLQRKDEFGNYKKDRSYPTYQTEYVLEEKGVIVEISQLLSKTTPSHLAKKLNEVRQLYISAQRTLKKHAWQVLVDGFDTTDSSRDFPIMRLQDGVSMYSTAHPSRVPGVANRSNRLASNPKFSPESAFAAQRMVREQKNGRGLEVGYEGQYVFVLPPALEKLGVEMFKSIKASDTANNDINYYNGISDLISVTYLGNSSNGKTNADTSFYCFAKNLEEDERSMKYVVLIPPKIEMQSDFDSKSLRVSIDGAWTFGYSNFELTAGSDGSNT
jgi:hypothetical protein